MAVDETGTLAQIRDFRREILEPLTSQFQGRLFKTMGDGFLIEFKSAVNAVAGGLAIQKSLEARNTLFTKEYQLKLRIGVNVGETLGEDEDVFGDGVNIAVRIENETPAGGVGLSGLVREHIGNRMDIGFLDLGKRRLKNIQSPIQIYLAVPAGTAPLRSEPVPGGSKSSIAVVPFTNMSGDPDQEYFADGVVEDIITALSKFKGLSVVARNSSFSYKGKAIDIRQVGRELDVRYVLEGSIRRSGPRLRLTGQLIEVATGLHLWAEHFDGQLEDVFDLQDKVTAKVVSALAPKLEQAEFQRVLKPGTVMDAYDCFIRGMGCYNRWAKESSDEALVYFYRCIELDPNYAAAYGMAARCYVQRKASQFRSVNAADAVETARLARLAGELGKEDVVALSAAGFALSYIVGDLETGDAYLSRALAFNPHYNVGRIQACWVKSWLGQPDASIALGEKAIELSPHDNYLFSVLSAIGLSRLCKQEFQLAKECGERTLREQPQFVPGYCLVAVSSAHLDDLEAACAAIRSLVKIHPHLTLADLQSHYFLKDRKHLEIWQTGIQKAWAAAFNQ